MSSENLFCIIMVISWYKITVSGDEKLKYYSFYQKLYKYILSLNGGGLRIIIIMEHNGIGKSNSNLDEAVFISLLTNIIGKGMRPSLAPPTMDKIVGHNGLPNIGKIISLRKGTL